MFSVLSGMGLPFWLNLSSTFHSPGSGLTERRSCAEAKGLAAATKIVTTERAVILTMLAPLRAGGLGGLDGLPDRERRRRHLDIAHALIAQRIEDAADHDGRGRGGGALA